MALVTATQVREAAVPSLSGTGKDTDLIEPMIARADAALATWCRYPAPSTGARRTMESASYVEYLTGLRADSRRLVLPWDDHRVTAITSIYDDSNRAWGSSTLVASGDYTLRAGLGDVLLSSTATHSGWTAEPEGAIKVTCTVGWTSSTVPLEVVQAIALLVSHWLRLKTESGHTSVSVQGASVGTRDEDIPASVAQLVRPFVLIPGGPL